MSKFKIKIILIPIIIVLALLLIYYVGRVSLKFIYPLKYKETIITQADEYNLEESLVFAVAKAESNFDNNAVSSKGAVGVMQIMPDTFNWLNKRQNKTEPFEDLQNYETNIKYGCYYLRVLIDYYKGDKTLAICAYNAGIGTVDKWIKNDENFVNEAKNLKVPYKETERYLKKIIKGQEIYHKLYNI